jgi:hypothetical protein
MSRPSWQLRDAALGYASQGIPVLPLHYPLPHHRGVQPVTDDGWLAHIAVAAGCSCRDPHCGQVAKHPLGVLVPHGVKEATTNRARVLAWWTQQPQANIGLATGGWHFYLAPTGLGNVAPRDLEQVDWRGRGGYVVAPPSRHRSGHRYRWVAGRDLDTPLAGVPAPLLERLQHRQADRPAPVSSAPIGDRPGPRYGQAALAQEVARVATASHGQRNRQLWEAARNLYNLVAAGALDHREVYQGLLQAAERCGLLGDEPRQTRRTLASGRQVGLAHPRPVPDRAHASPPPPARAGGERTQEGR